MGESGICLLACCCPPTVGACILSWAHVPPLSLKDFSRNLPTLPQVHRAPRLYSVYSSFVVWHPLPYRPAESGHTDPR